MASGLTPTEEELLRNEIASLKTSLATETERCEQLTDEITRLRGALGRASSSLNETSVLCSNMNQLKNERDMLKKQLDDQIKYKREPLEAQLADANRVLFEQRLQFRSIVDVLASQRDWVREWAVQCQENLRLQDLLSKREAGTEVEELRKHLLETHAKLTEAIMSIKHRDASAAVHESRARSLALDNNRLTAECNLLREQNRRLWRRATGGGGKAVASAAREKTPCVGNGEAGGRGAP